MNTKAYLVTSGTLFGLIAILQAGRLLSRWPVEVGTWTVPLWASGIAVIVAAGLCIWAFSLTVKKGDVLRHQVDLVLHQVLELSRQISIAVHHPRVDHLLFARHDNDDQALSCFYQRRVGLGEEQLAVF